MKPIAHELSGADLKRLGQELALANAGDEWAADMLEKLWAYCKYLRDEGRSTFRFEEFRELALAAQWPAPPTSKAWGGLASAAVKAGIIESTGLYQKAQSKRTHAHPVLVWRTL